MNPSLILKRTLRKSRLMDTDRCEHYRLLLRIQDPLRNAYHYRTIDGSVDRTLYNLDRRNNY